MGARLCTVRWTPDGGCLECVQLSSEINTCRGELSSMEQELQRLRRDTSMNSSQLSYAEETLQKTQGLLEEKTDAVVDLEEKLHCCEEDRRNSVQRVKDLEGQLREVRDEMHDTLEKLQELRDLLQRTQLSADERQISLEKLSAELRSAASTLEVTRAVYGQCDHGNR
ncbi:coiled-coil domain-containing protein 18-like isoform X2 [Salmo trutta]|uniref:coiled-coil domain-containing protein 18-like isoform X2 n=1 Tax=Salmo trutta TaxID=8032 RepID=UPI0011313881|nr:coiled-coil domain-containing protein 18-like isoform X2 [Salmo trutta]